MPCRDYDIGDSTHTSALRAECDKLARISCKIMEHFVQSGDPATLAIILQDKEVAEWWDKHQEDDRKAKEAHLLEQAKEAELRRLSEIKEELLSRLTSEQIKALGIK